jgi:hypothetical protein
MKTLAECLLRRKELQEKVDQLHKINHKELYDIRVSRVKITDSVDEVTANVPIMTFDRLTAEYNFYAKALRNIDAVIQQSNWTTQLDSVDEWFTDYQAPESK